MSLFDELFPDGLGESRAESPKVASKSPAENGSITRVIAQSPLSPSLCDEKAAQTVEEPHRPDAAMVSGEAPCPTCGCGSLWRDQAGAWRCEQCAPPGKEHVATWRNFSGGKLPSAPRPVEQWPADMNQLLRRVTAYYEWTDADRREFIAWARRSPEGLADARRFLEAEAAKLPVPGPTDRPRVALDR